MTNELYAAALEIQSQCAQRGWRFCLIGGMAVARWGRPRATQDVDLTLLTGIGDEEEFAATLLASFTGRLDDAADFAVVNRVLLLYASNGIAIDIGFGALPFEERVVDRATWYDYEDDVSLLTASAEDLMVMKVFASRPQDWIDVADIAVRQGAQLDWALIDSEVCELFNLAETEPPLERLGDLRRLAEQP